MQAAISDLIEGKLTQTETRLSSVTTKWGVKWGPDEIARDLLQNFRDSHKGEEEVIQIRVEANNTVNISAPGVFDLDELFFLWSGKGEEDIGEYGEGAKAAFLCLLRDYHVQPISVSGGSAVEIRIQENGHKTARFRPLEYCYFKVSPAIKETQLILPHCSSDLIGALKQGLNHFFYTANPLVGEELWRHWEGHFAMHRSTRTEGYVFYRGLRRGTIPGIPLILSVSKPYQRLEKKIAKDRDRNAFGEALMGDFYSIFVQFGLKQDWPAQRIVVEAARNIWVVGHPLLAAISQSGFSWYGVGEQWPKALTTEVFGADYFAKSPQGDVNLHIQIADIEKGWIEAGRKTLPGYFHKFGVPSAAGVIEAQKRKVREEEQKRVHPPTLAESRGIKILSAVMEAIAPEVSALFRNKLVSYAVGQTEEIVGTMQRGRGYNSVQVFLTEQLFVDEFSVALATFIHEHSHIFAGC